MTLVNFLFGAFCYNKRVLKKQTKSLRMFRVFFFSSIISIIRNLCSIQAKLFLEITLNSVMPHGLHVEKFTTNNITSQLLCRQIVHSLVVLTLTILVPEDMTLISFSTCRKAQILKFLRCIICGLYFQEIYLQVCIRHVKSTICSNRAFINISELL